MSSFVSLLPNDLLSFILLEWIGSIDDFIALDRSFINRILREKYLCCCRTNIKSSGLKAPISIGLINKSCEVLKTFIVWKEKRGLVLNKLILWRDSVEINKYLVYLCDLKELHILTFFGVKDYFHINVIFSGMFNRLEELHLSLPSLSYDKELLGVVKQTRLVIAGCKVFPLLKPIAATSRGVINAQELNQFYEWMGKCCPLVESLELTELTIKSPYVFLVMFSNMPNLSTLKYNVCWDNMSSVDTSLSLKTEEYQFPNLKNSFLMKTAKNEILVLL